MKTIVFTNKKFYGLLVVYIVLLLIYNFYMAINVNFIFGIIPVSIQVILLILIFTKVSYARLSIMIWAIVFLIIGYSLKLIGDILVDFSNNFKTFKGNKYIYNMVELSIGIVIADYTRRTVVIISKDCID